MTKLNPSITPFLELGRHILREQRHMMDAEVRLPSIQAKSESIRKTT
jgi:hypothetical protein